MNIPHITYDDIISLLIVIRLLEDAELLNFEYREIEMYNLMMLLALKISPFDSIISHIALLKYHLRLSLAI